MLITERNWIKEVSMDFLKSNARGKLSTSYFAELMLE